VSPPAIAEMLRANLQATDVVSRLCNILLSAASHRITAIVSVRLAANDNEAGNDLIDSFQITSHLLLLTLYNGEPSVLPIFLQFPHHSAVY
jgi:hypothetical protein